MNTTNWHQLHQPGMGSISSMALSAELHTVLRNCLIQNSTGYSYYSWKTSSWQMVTRWLHTYFHSDPLEEAKGRSRGWDACQKKASHNSSSCWSMVTSLSPPLLSRFLDNYSFTIKEPAAACHSCPEASRSSIPRKHRLFFFYFFFFNGNNYSLPLSTRQKCGLNRKKHFKIRRFKWYG